MTADPSALATNQAAPPATHPVALRASGLGRRFGELWAVRGLDLEVRRGRVVGLLGPNGAGKTTTVRMLTALIEPTEGTATIDGFDVRTDPDAVRARVGILTETPGLYDKLTAEANLDFFGRLYGLAGRDAGDEHRALPAPVRAVGSPPRRCRHLQQGHEAEAGDRPGAAP